MIIKNAGCVEYVTLNDLFRELAFSNGNFLDEPWLASSPAWFSSSLSFRHVCV